MVLRLSRSRRWLAPLALSVGAFAMLFEGVKLLFTNWRLTLIQVLPDVDLGRHVRPEGSCAARQVVPYADRADV